MFGLHTIGRRCRRFRERKGLSQTYVAECVPTTQANISRFENGQNNNAMILTTYIMLGLTTYELTTGKEV